MVDEFQDTNRLQCDLVDLLTGPGTEVFFVGDEFQSIYGFRHADVQVFRERRAAAETLLPLTRNYRSRAEVLGVVNHLFAAEFGDEFQELAASGDFLDPVFGTPVELLVTDKAAYADSGAALAARRGAGTSRGGFASSSRAAPRAPARSSSCSPREPTRSGTRRSCARPACPRTARRVAATSASSRWSTSSRTCACCTTATTTRRS